VVFLRRGESIKNRHNVGIPDNCGFTHNCDKSVTIRPGCAAAIQSIRAANYSNNIFLCRKNRSMQGEQWQISGINGNFHG